MNAMQNRPLQPERKIQPLFLTANGHQPSSYYAVIPDDMRAGAVPLVVVHGISRNAAELALRFGEIACMTGTPVIAPLFEREAFGMYQQVRDPARGLACDDALFAILDDAAQRFGCGRTCINLFGFSGGAQFAHRFAMLHPERVRSCVVAAAGWYTMPDPASEWPLGLGSAPLVAERAAIAQVRFDVIVGGNDRLQDKALRRSNEIDAAQGTHRLQRARRWHRAMRRAGLGAGGLLTIVPGLGHAFGDAAYLGIVPLTLHLLGMDRVNSRETAE